MQQPILSILLKLSTMNVFLLGQRFLCFPKVICSISFYFIVAIVLCSTTIFTGRVVNPVWKQTHTLQGIRAQKATIKSCFKDYFIPYTILKKIMTTGIYTYI